MADLEQVRELAAAGRSMVEAAIELGVTRARVHQIAKGHNLKFKDGRLRAHRKPPHPRVETGGPHVILTPSVAGKAAELLVAADLLARGWQVFLPVFSNRGHDLCAFVPGHLISIEVRSARRNPTGNIVFNKRVTDLSMHYALVTSGEVIRYVPELPAGWGAMPDGTRGLVEYIPSVLVD